MGNGPPGATVRPASYREASVEAANNTDPAPLLSRKAAFSLGFNEQKNKEGEKSTEASSLFLAVGLVQRKDFEKEKKH